MKIVLATSNRNKIEEIKELLKAPGLEIVSPAAFGSSPPVAEEDGKTFMENARKKAIATAQWSGMLTLADDSGLVVDALEGEPGIRSARFAGPDGDTDANNALLLERMKDVPDGQRSARFLCVVCLASPLGVTWEAEGTVEGSITRKRIGKKGFGYDPIFFYDPAGVTFAQMDPEKKNSVSHRAVAIKALARRIPEIKEELEKLS